MQGELDESHSEVKAAHDKASYAISEAARYSDDLRTAQVLINKKFS